MSISTFVLFVFKYIKHSGYKYINASNACNETSCFFFLNVCTYTIIHSHIGTGTFITGYNHTVCMHMSCMIMCTNRDSCMTWWTYPECLWSMCKCSPNLHRATLTLFRPVKPRLYGSGASYPDNDSFCILRLNDTLSRCGLFGQPNVPLLTCVQLQK